MRSNKLRTALFLVVLLAGCGGGGGGDNNNNNPPPPPTGSNELTVTVNGALADPATSSGYINKPAVSVTICEPGSTTNCQTINDILLDTGSYGLRIFSSAITVPLTQVPVGPATLGECIHFADGTTSWGPVKIANVILGGEPAVQVPIQVLDTSFFPQAITGPGSVCGTPDASPAAAGFHGILGVGVFAQDCGPGCVSSNANRVYFACSDSNCTGTSVPLAAQVQNPVSALPQDNNGVLIQLPAVPTTGAPLVNGRVLLGIGTRPNNTPGTVTTFSVATTGNFPTFFTTLNGTTYNSFLDTGSNGIFIPASANLLPVCASPFDAWYCPPDTTTINVTNRAATGSVSAPLSFQIGNFQSLINTGNNVFNDIGGPSPGSEIDFGLPFFLGRDVFIGYEGRSSTLGTGPYWAF
ncbi:DUF3443 domain-containing protein [Geomonas sp. RF6]|uniref:DUF3443 family protein n=1 Tax=Geomonas sp. RF6 TaxID=2897342 RepID=UPI001E32320F|nr:DUF3443 family protein [Geomonas sp. RF6]UFS70809.1 DUF3443 domain-containing protein [Geomonas sp. RF6]